MSRQYVAVKFNPWDRRTYTYHNDGEPVMTGDSVEVETKDGAKVVVVESVSIAAPEFETKAIVRKVDEAA